MEDHVARSHSVSERKLRGRKLRRTRRLKLQETFEGKKFVVLGEVRLPPGEYFYTPFGQKARYGFALQEIDNPQNQFLVGIGVLRRAALDYRAVDLPEKLQRHKASQEAEKLARWRAKQDPASVRNLFGWE